MENNVTNKMPKNPTQVVNLQLTGTVQKTQTHVPKAYFRSKKIEYNEKSMGVTHWIPKASPAMKKPSVCLTLNINTDRLRIYAEDVTELESMIEGLYLEFQKNKDLLRKAHQEEVQQWRTIQKAIENATNQ